MRRNSQQSVKCSTVSSMTNLDKIRTMPPEELGAFLSNLVAIEDCFECPIRDVCNERMVNPNNEAFHTCELSFYHWLQREYKPGYFENQEERGAMITVESKAKLFEKTYDAYLLAQSVTRVYGVESPPGQSAMKKLRAEVKACSDKDLLEEYLDYQDRENKRIESIWGEW